MAGTAAALFLALAVAVVARGGAPFAVDAALHERAVAGRVGWLTNVALAVTATGSGLPAYALAAVAGFGAGARHRWLTAGGYVLALLAGQGIRLVIVNLCGRPRPPVADWAGAASGASFPSGHTTTSALVAALICWTASRRLSPIWRKALIALALTWAAAVGLTRVYLGVHWPTDVLGGWLLAAALVGLAVGLNALLAHRTRARQRRFTHI